MATASSTHPAGGAKRRRGTSGLTALIARDALRRWAVPGVAGAALVGGAVLGAAGLLAPRGLAATVVAALVLLLWVGEQPLLEPGVARRPRLVGAGLGLVWFAACYAPFHARFFPGAPLVDGARVTAAGDGLPLRIPAAGHAAVDLVLVGTLDPGEEGGALPLRFRLTIDGGDAEPRTAEGVFEEAVRARRPDRDGAAGGPRSHRAGVRLLPNPGRADLTVTELVLEPASTEPIAISAYPQPRPPPLVVGLAVALLLVAVAAFDRLAPVAATDGALTVATGGVVGTAVILWTSNTVRPTFSTLIGSAIFGGLLGSAAASLVWWVAKRLVVRPAR
jgi:hypothetical protein